jgi:acylphosphatase
MKRVRVTVSGDVHGVGFRSITKHRAGKIGVRGWVRNNSDGTVEAVFEGDDEKVSDMVEWCKKGPPTSYVETVEVVEEKYSGEFKSFEIVY